MTITSTLNAIGNVVVDVTPNASAAYPVISIRRTTKVTGAPGVNAESYREESWEMRCLAFAAASTAITALNETLRTELAKRGARVTLDEWGTSRTLPEGGIAGGSLPGFPEIELIDSETESFGPMQAFTLRATTRIPIVAVDNLVEHDYTRDESTDADGKVSIKQSGTVRVANGQDARTYAQTNFVDPEAAAAASNNQAFTIKWTIGQDSATVQYDLGRAPRDSTLPGNVVEASVTDRTNTTAEGRIVRTISGWAKGSGAQAYVDGLKVAPTSTNILRREDSTPATVPDERINFTYEYLQGAVDANWPNLVIVSFEQSIDLQPGGSQVQAATYFDADPVLRATDRRPWVYVERTSMEFVGSWTAWDVNTTMDPNFLVNVGAAQFSARGGIKRGVLTRTYMFPTQQTTPAPYELAPLT